jgi:hypothetical protein
LNLTKYLFADWDILIMPPNLLVQSFEQFMRENNIIFGDEINGGPYIY